MKSFEAQSKVQKENTQTHTHTHTHTQTFAIDKFRSRNFAAIGMSRSKISDLASDRIGSTKIRQGVLLGLKTWWSGKAKYLGPQTRPYVTANFGPSLAPPPNPPKFQTLVATIRVIGVNM